MRSSSFPPSPCSLGTFILWFFVRVSANGNYGSGSSQVWSELPLTDQVQVTGPLTKTVSFLSPVHEIGKYCMFFYRLFLMTGQASNEILVIFFPCKATKGVENKIWKLFRKK